MEAIYIEYASKGLGVTGATLGGVALGTSLLGGGNLLGNLLGVNNCNCHENQAVNRYEMNMQNQITNKDMEIAYLRSRDAAKSDTLELYKYIDGKIEGINAAICQQNVYNATNTATLGCMQGQIAQLMSLTKCVIPATSVCPTPMAMYNSWTAPTTTTGG